ncbi:MAG: hypothetical protein OSJ37_00930 [Muribaculaceae bacterium]|nr:hypothetical protein [Muribaculaceae bacterium]
MAQRYEICGTWQNLRPDGTQPQKRRYGVLSVADELPRRSD